MVQGLDNTKLSHLAFLNVREAIRFQTRVGLAVLGLWVGATLVVLSAYAPTVTSVIAAFVSCLIAIAWAKRWQPRVIAERRRVREASTGRGVEFQAAMVAQLADEAKLEAELSAIRMDLLRTEAKVNALSGWVSRLTRIQTQASVESSNIEEAENEE